MTTATKADLIRDLGEKREEMAGRVARAERMGDARRAEQYRRELDSLAATLRIVAGSN